MTGPCLGHGWCERGSISIALFAVVVAGCAAGESQGPVPPAVPTINVQIEEYGLSYTRPIPAGRVVFHIVNTGDHVHRLALLPLSEDVPPILEELRNDTGRSVTLQGRVPNLQPGQTGMFAVDLKKGQRYALVDFSRDPTGRLHGERGIASEFHAGRAPAEGTPRAYAEPVTATSTPKDK